MDNWTEANLLAMLLGGNRQLRSFFKRLPCGNNTQGTPCNDAIYTAVREYSAFVDAPWSVGG